MQCGVHLFFALLLCPLVPKRKQWGARAGLFRYGLVLGAILPDIDLPVAVLMVRESVPHMLHPHFTLA